MVRRVSGAGIGRWMRYIPIEGLRLGGVQVQPGAAVQRAADLPAEERQPGGHRPQHPLRPAAVCRPQHDPRGGEEAVLPALGAAALQGGVGGGAADQGARRACGIYFYAAARERSLPHGVRDGHGVLPLNGGRQHGHVA
eukprot:1196153-Prorocentrum_minimum.AAC.2